MARKRKGKGVRCSCLSQAQIDWAYDKWCSGYSHKEIASALFVSEATISRALSGRKKALMPLNPPKT